MQIIGRFQITRELGRGGMGVVYEAVDPVIGRTVAVKTVRLDTPAPTDFLLDRLFREARSAGALAHPNIVIIFDVGHDADLAYIAMERVDGPTLESLIDSGGLAHDAMLDILRQTADALDYAHESGIVHRDIKPANIMVHRGKTVKITDFGIAKLLETSGQSSLIMGTPGYMSPEQLAAKPVDGRSDQFSLAVVAFRMLTGRDAFPADDPAAVVYKIVHGPAPSVIASHPLLRAVDPVLNRALAKDPEDRYRTCSEFVNALSVALAPTIREATIPAPRQAATAAKRPLRLWFKFAAAAVALILGWFGYDLYNRWQRRASPTTLAAHRDGPVEPVKTVPQTPAPRRSDPKPADSERAKKPPDPSPSEPTPVQPPDHGITTKTNPKDGLVYVWIPSGTFAMGCSAGEPCGDDMRPQHLVTISKGFWIGQTEVTQEVYLKMYGRNPSHFIGAKLPVEQVTWTDAKKYCEATGMRLPTEAEWEYAARGGNPAAHYGSVAAIAWYQDNSGKTTHAVASKQKNKFGLYDMLGNVAEWVADFYGQNYYETSPRVDPTGPSTERFYVVRGGHWDSIDLWATVSKRDYAGDWARNDTGFRCAGN